MLFVAGCALHPTWASVRDTVLNAHLLVDDVGPDLEGSTAGEGRDVVDMVLSGKNTYINRH